MGNFDILAQRLKALRAKMSMTQKEFSEKIGFTQATLSAYENGQKKPSLDIIMEIAKQCHVSIDWLCGLSEQMRNDDTPQTYADVIDLLVKAEKSVHFHVGKQKITVSDSVLQYFLDAWVKCSHYFTMEQLIINYINYG